MRFFTCILLTTSTVAFRPLTVHRVQRVSSLAVVLSMADNSSDNINDDPPKLVLGDDVDNEMAQIKSKYPTSENAFLAAARARNEAKVASRETEATDEDWQQMAEAKREAIGEIDDWENSAQEAGNMDSQILIPMMESTDEDGGDEEEPKLLLF